jgi:hypothetical protein
MTLVDLRGGGAVLTTTVPNKPPPNNIAAIATPNNDFFITMPSRVWSPSTVLMPPFRTRASNFFAWPGVGAACYTGFAGNCFPITPFCRFRGTLSGWCSCEVSRSAFGVLAFAWPHVKIATLDGGPSQCQAREKPMLSSITSVGPIGTLPGLGRLSFSKTILSCQTFRRKSSITMIVSCSPGQRR